MHEIHRHRRGAVRCGRAARRDNRPRYGRGADRSGDAHAAVASPAYFSARKVPRTPHDLSVHNCINLRFPTRGGLYAWEFEKAERALNVRLEGQLIVNEIALALRGALDGLGIAYLPEDYVRADIEAERLTRVLESWCPPFTGYHPITRAAVINRRPSRFWWRRCATGLNAPSVGGVLLPAHCPMRARFIVACRSPTLTAPRSASGRSPTS